MIPMHPPRIGDIVRYVLPGHAMRPAIVVHVWTAQCVNLQVFTNGLSDGVSAEQGTLLRTSVVYDGETKVPGSWHWEEDAPVAVPPNEPTGG